MIKKKKKLAYIGPTIRNMAVHGTVYAGTIPEALVRAKKQIPILADLIVPAESFAEAMRSIKTPGTALFIKYNTVAKAIKEGVK